VARAPEKVLAVRGAWLDGRDAVLQRLLRALDRAAAFINDPANIADVAKLVAAPHRVDVAPELVRSALQGTLRVSLHGAPRTAPTYLLVGRDGAARPEPRHAAWLYAQMVRWRQAVLSDEVLAAALSCFRPDLFDSAIGKRSGEVAGVPPDGVGAFAGPAFNSEDISGYVKACAPNK